MANQPKTTTDSTLSAVEKALDLEDDANGVDTAAGAQDASTDDASSRSATKSGKKAGKARRSGKSDAQLEEDVLNDLALSLSDDDGRSARSRRPTTTVPASKPFCTGCSAAPRRPRSWLPGCSPRCGHSSVS